MKSDILNMRSAYHLFKCWKLIFYRRRCSMLFTATVYTQFVVDDNELWTANYQVYVRICSQNIQFKNFVILLINQNTLHLIIKLTATATEIKLNVQAIDKRVVINKLHIIIVVAVIIVWYRNRRDKCAHTSGLAQFRVLNT